MNILILEDEPVSLKMLSDDLTKQGHRVFEAKNSIEGLTIFTGNKNLGLIITDLKMPMGSGEDFVKDVRRLNQRIPIIIITGTIDKEVLAKVKSLKCLDILVKPYNRERLKSRISKINSD